jgi:hypothetical protein
VELLSTASGSRMAAKFGFVRFVASSDQKLLALLTRMREYVLVSLFVHPYA